MILQAKIAANLNRASRMLRYFKPKSATPANSVNSNCSSSVSDSASTTAAATTSTSNEASAANMTYSTTSSHISSLDLANSHGNISRTSNTDNDSANVVTVSQTALAGVALSEYYKQIGLTTMHMQQTHQHEQLVAQNLATGNKDEQHSASNVEYQIRPQNEATQYHLAEGNSSLHMNTRNMPSSASESEETVIVPLTVAAVSEEPAEEPQAKRLKLDDTTRTSQAERSADHETGTPAHNHQMFTGNTWRASSSTSTTTSSSSSPSSTSSSSKTKTTTALRGTSKLPIQTSLHTSDNKTLSIMQPMKRKIGLHVTPEMKAMLMWQKVRAENLDCDYVKVFNKREADELFQECEKTLTYYTGDLAQIKVYGKRYDIPRKQVAHGDEGISYTYSGVSVPAKPWTPVLSVIRERIQEVTQHTFNFVLINRYEDGNHYMGEHRDDEKDLRRAAPIASVSLGCTRDFVFRHADSRGREAKRQIPPIKLQLEHGSLLVMKYPTNVHWYHSLPVRRKATLPRINFTFRDIIIKGDK